MTSNRKPIILFVVAALSLLLGAMTLLAEPETTTIINQTSNTNSSKVVRFQADLLAGDEISATVNTTDPWSPRLSVTNLTTGQRVVTEASAYPVTFTAAADGTYEFAVIDPCTSETCAANSFTIVVDRTRDIATETPDPTEDPTPDPTEDPTQTPDPVVTPAPIDNPLPLDPGECEAALDDGRLNNDPTWHCAAPVAVYPNGEFYAINHEDSELSLLEIRLTQAIMDEPAPSTNTMLAETVHPYSGQPIRIYRLTTGEFQMNTYYANGKSYIVVWHDIELYHLDV